MLRKEVVELKPYLLVHYDKGYGELTKVSLKIRRLAHEMGCQDYALSESYDHSEGGLESVTIHHSENSTELFEAIAKLFDFELDANKELDIVLSYW